MVSCGPVKFQYLYCKHKEMMVVDKVLAMNGKIRKVKCGWNKTV